MYDLAAKYIWLLNAIIELIATYVKSEKCQAVDSSFVTAIYKCDQIYHKGSYTCIRTFRSYFSWSFDIYNNRPTVHACTIAKASTVCFYWDLIHGPIWRPRMLWWSVNVSNFPSQEDSRQGITTGLAGETGCQCSYIWDVWSWKQPELKPFGHKKFLYSKFPPLRGSPPPPPFTSIGMLVVLTTLWNKLSKMAGISTSYPLKSPSTEWSWLL